MTLLETYFELPHQLWVSYAMLGQSPTGVVLGANDGPDAQLLLITELRDTRRAVLDSGTAAELAITTLLRVQLPNDADDQFEKSLDDNPMLGRRKALLEKARRGPSSRHPEEANQQAERRCSRRQQSDPQRILRALLIEVGIVEAAYPLTPYRQI